MYIQFTYKEEINTHISDYFFQNYIFLCAKLNKLEMQIVIIFTQFFPIVKSCDLFRFKIKRPIVSSILLYIFLTNIFSICCIEPQIESRIFNRRRYNIGWDSIKAVAVRNRTARVEEWCASWPWTIRKADEINRAIKADGQTLTC